MVNDVTLEERAEAIADLELDIANCPNPDVPLAGGTWTLRELIAEIKGDTEFGKLLLAEWVSLKRESAKDKPIGRRIQVFVNQEEDGTYSLDIECGGFDAEHLLKMFKAMDALADDDTFLTLPVIRELESPEFLESLERSIADYEAHPGEGMSTTQLRMSLIARQLGGENRKTTAPPPRPRAMTMPDVFTPETPTEPAPAGFEESYQNGNRVFVRIPR